MVKLTVEFYSKVFKHSYLINHWQVSFHTWNIIISYHWLALQNSIFQGQALEKGLMGQKLGYTYFKVVWQSSFKQSYLSSNHWQEPSHIWYIIYIIAVPFIKHFTPESGHGAGKRGQELGHIHFEIFSKVFLTFTSQQSMARSLPFLEQNHIKALPPISILFYFIP